MTRPIVYHIPVCPFSQRVEILLALKGMSDAVEFRVVDITVPRPSWLLEATGGSTALPVLVESATTGPSDARNASPMVLRESLVLMQYLDDRFPETRVAQRDPMRRAIEMLMTTLERDFVAAGYRLLMNQDRAKREEHHARMVAQYEELDAFLTRYAQGETFLFDTFGWAEAVFTPMFMRFWFLEYYEGFTLPSRLERVRRFHDTCIAHPAAQQVTKAEIVKLYYDYAKGAGNGALVPGRTRSSFVFEPHWSARPMPPADKYGVSATDEALGLVPAERP